MPETNYTRRPLFTKGQRSYWKGSERVLAPQDAILDEDGNEILDEDSLAMLTE